MTEFSDFTFKDDAIANAYNNVLAPVIFEPWAIAFVEEHPELDGRRGAWLLVERVCWRWRIPRHRVLYTG